jgi:uncharacterized surface anchored protein
LYSVSGDTSSVSDDTASITTPDIPVGEYQVCITGTDEAGNTLAPADGNACRTVTVTLEGENSFSVDLAQVRGSISGTVTAAGTGDAIQGVAVTVKDGTTTVGTATTGADGTYSVTDLPAGSYDVVFTDAPAYLPLTKSDVTVEQGADTTVDAALTEAPGSISGSVTALDGGAPLAGVTVTVQDGATTVGTATTGADGGYTVTGVPAGTYDVVFSKAPTYLSATVPNVTVQPGVQTSGVDAGLAIAPGSISGTVTAADGGDPIQGVTVTAYDATTGAPAAAAVVTGADGSYTVTGLAAGSYTVCFDASGATSGNFVNTCDEGVTVTAGVATTHDVALASAPATVTCDPAIFWDVHGGQFCADITWLSQQNITTGYQDSGHTLPGFHPGANITRQAMAAFLYRFANHVQQVPACSTGSLPFNDIAGTPFCGAVEWMFEQGLSKPYPDGGFHPGVRITRQAMAAMIYRLVNGTDNIPACSTGSLPFNDIAGTPFCGAIEWMGEQGLSNPYPDGGYHPGRSVSRQAMAAFLHRLAQHTSITGTVTGADDAALAGVSVVVTASDDSAEYSTQTAADGTYRVPGLSAGNYTVCFDPGAVAGGYVLECYDDAVGNATPDPVTVTNWTPTEVDASLQASAP